jgi:TP901 family phage tail tape measure protein
MTDIESNISINVDISNALSGLKALQKEISVFHQEMAKSGATSSAQLANMQQNLIKSINATGQFSASMQKIETTTESFTRSLERNKLSLGEYFRYAGASSKTFGKLFSNEFDTIEKVARERVKDIQTQYIKLGRDASGAMQSIAVRPQVLDMKDLATQTAIANQKTQLFNQLMSQGSTNLLNFGKNTQWAGRQLMVGFTVPLGIMGQAASREFQKIEEQVIRLQRVYGDFTTTVADTKEVTQQVKDLAGEFTKYGVAVEKTIGLAADAAAMGKTGADLIAQVSQANRLAVLGGVDQQQSLDTTISLTNAFGVSADKLAGKIDFLNAVENQTVTSIQDMTTAIPIAAPVIEQLGGKVEDLTFFLTAMKEGGINASEGANALKSGLAAIINPTTEATQMLDGFGISIQGIVQKDSGNVKQMILDVGTALNSLDPLNRAQAIETMFGKFQFSRMSTLFKNVTEQGTQAAKVLDLTKASASELAAMSSKELAKIEASPLYKYKKALEDFQAAMAPLGEQFMKAVTPLINFGTDLLNKFNEMDGGVKQVVISIVGVLAGIAPAAIMGFGLIANGAAMLIKGFLFLRNIFSGTGKSSKLLTDQLSYMTEDQLKAQAVAVSLGQVHSNLIGTFNAEAGSVRNLAKAYQEAIAVQNSFTGPIMTPGGMRTSVKKASGGIISGPGTGTSDSIPAMLSNGEAVIPAGVVKKYPGLVNGLIAGNVGHFAYGTNGRSGKFGVPTQISNMFGQYGSNPAQASHYAMFAPYQMSSTIKRAEKYLENTAVTIFTIGEKLKNGTREVTVSTEELSSLANRNIDIVAGGQTAAGTTTIEQGRRNQAYNTAGILGSAFTLEQTVEHGKKAAAALASQSSGSITYAKELQDLVNEGQIAEKAMASSTSAQQRLQFMLGNAEKTLVESEPATRRVKTVEEAHIISSQKLTKIQNQYTKLLASGMSQNAALIEAELMLTAAMLKSGTGEFVVGQPGTGGNVGRDVASGRGPRSRDNYIAKRVFTENDPANTQSRRFAYGGMSTRHLTAIIYQHAIESGMSTIQAFQKAFIGGIKSFLKINSPSLELNEVGQDAGRGLEQGARSRIDDAKVVGTELGTAIVSNTQKAKTKGTGSAFGNIAANAPTPYIISPAAMQHFKDTAPKIIGPIPNMATAQLTQYKLLTGEELKVVKEKRAQIEQEIRLRKERLAEAASTQTNYAVPIIPEEESEPNQKGKVKQPKKRFNGLGGIGMAASMGLMMAQGQEGPIGDIASTISGPLMAVSTALTFLPGPIGLVVAGLAAAVTGFIAFNGMIDSAAQKGRDLADSMSLTKDKLSGLSDLTGKTAFSTTAKNNEDARLAGIKSGMSAEATDAINKFKDQFASSDVGQSFIKNIKDQISNGSSITDVAKNMSVQLSSAIAEGVLSKDQADAIAASLGESIQSKTFTIQLQGQLSNIVGRNGENLTNNPGAVANTITNKTNEQAYSSGNTAALKNKGNPLQSSGNILAGAGAGAGAGALGAAALIGTAELATGATALGGALASTATGTLMATAGLGLAGSATGIGAVVGISALIAAGVVSVVEMAKHQEEVAKYAGLAAGAYSEAYSQNIKMTDAINGQYDSLIKNKQAQLDSATTDQDRIKYATELKALQDGQATALNNQKTASKDLVDNAVKTKNALGKDTFNKAINDQVDKTYKDNALGQEQAKANLGRLNATHGEQTTINLQGKETEVTMQKANYSEDVIAKLQLQISSGQISNEAAAKIIDGLNNDKNAQKNYMAAINVVGDKDVINTMEALTAAGATGETIKSQIDVISNSKDPKKTIQEIQQISDSVSKLNQMGIKVDINDKDTYNRLKGVQDDIAGLDSFIANNSPLTAEIMMNTYGIEMTKEAMDYYNSLSAGDQKTFMTTYLTVKKTIDADSAVGQAELEDWARNHGGMNKYTSGPGYTPGQGGGGYSSKVDWNKIATDRAAAEATTSIAQSQASVIPPTSSGPDGGGGGSAQKDPTSFLDGIVASIRKVTTAAQGMTDTFNDSWAAISSLFGSGAPTSIFSGIEQQMRALGASEDLVNLVTGMSKDEWDKYKDQMFNFDANGNIVGLKDMLTAVGRALATVKLGEFQSKQQAAVKTSLDQSAAISKIVAAGGSYAQAYEIVQDAATAAAIAQETNIQKIKDLTTAAKQASVALTTMSAAQDVANTNQSAANMSKVTASILGYGKALSSAQITAILGSEKLQTLMLNFSTLTVDQLRVLDTALADADNQAAEALKQKMLTPEGLQEIFNDGYSKAMEQFSAKEEKINIDFQVKKNPLENIIRDAQTNIRNLKDQPGGLNDLEADVTRINDKESEINKKYEDRSKALDEIQRANDRVANQQKAQLSVADALAVGDISAAARAIQEKRAADAAQAQTDARDALKKAQDLELANLTGQMGLTKAQLEEQIKNVKQQVFEIEQNTIEPAQHQLDLLNDQEQAAIRNLTVLGKTKEEWTTIKNNVELARVSTTDYENSMKLSVDHAQDLIDKWTEIQKPKTTIHTVITNQINKKENESAAATQTTAPTPAPAAPAHDEAWVNDMARRVIRGEFGNGQARIDALGADYQTVQNRVNDMIYHRNGYASGGLVTSYLSSLGSTKPAFKPSGTDTVPAMLTPGEFVVRKQAVDRVGLSFLNAINDGLMGGKQNSQLSALQNGMYSINNNKPFVPNDRYPAENLGAVQSNSLSSIKDMLNSGSVYNNNYNISVNVKSDANANEIARTVMMQIKNIDDQRVRGNRF